jgi:4,5-DOPA dioxygenase extradiol
LSVVLDQQWGLDHGCWAVMKHLFPQADVPVVQLSIDMNRDAQWHYDLGKQLTALRDEGILIVGSGNVVHNLGQLDFSDSGQVFPWAKLFNDHVRQCIATCNHQSLIQYQQGDEVLRRAAMTSVPTPDHYYPLLYVLGASNGNNLVEILLDEIVLGSIAMLSVKLG